MSFAHFLAALSGRPSSRPRPSARPSISARRVGFGPFCLDRGEERGNEGGERLHRKADRVGDYESRGLTYCKLFARFLSCMPKGEGGAIQAFSILHSTAAAAAGDSD